MIIKTYVSAPRWAGVKKALYEGAGISHVDLTIIDQDRGFIRETIYFQVEGEEDNLKQFLKVVKAGIDDYNS